jgi:hypothetical protein
MTIKGYRDKYSKFHTSLPDVIAAEVARTSDVLLDLNRDQMLYGRDAKGEVLTPDYVDDPYFKKFRNPILRAVNYKKMKMALEDTHYGRMRFGHVQLFPDKSEDTPNLVVNGNWFMNLLFINVDKESYTIGSSGIAAADIQTKYAAYGHPVFGLAPVSKKYYYFGFIRPVIEANFNKHMK